MKHRSTTPVFNKKIVVRAIIIAGFVLTTVASPFFVAKPTYADEFDAKIAAIQKQIDAYQAEARALSKEADTLKNKLDMFSKQKAAIQAKIDETEVQKSKLENEIEATKKKIDNNKNALGEIVASMYVDDTISPLEMLASSSNIGDYVDKQEYRTSVQNSLSDKIKEVKELKKKLDEQKVGIERALADQKGAREALTAKESEQATLIAQVRNQEDAYQNLSTQAKAEKDRVQAAQQAAIAAAMRRAGSSGGSAVAGDPAKGGYPANLANSNYYNPVVDPWGMYSRQCVSYTAWKVFQKNGYMPYWGGRGNANQWPGNARGAGIPVSTTPRAGSVGVIMDGQYGHVVWVESVNGNGTINISQYNYFNAGGSGWGHYSEMYNVSPAAYDYYIYF